MIRKFDRLVVCSEKPMPQILAEMFEGLPSAEKVDFFIRIGAKGIVHHQEKHPDGTTTAIQYPLDSLLVDAL